jgi:hypothetical protein
LRADPERVGTDPLGSAILAERVLRGIALGRKSGLFAGSDRVDLQPTSLTRGGQRAAAMYSLIVTAKLNDADPQAWLADVLARITAHPAHRIMRCCLALAAEIGPAQLGGLKQPL